MRRFAPVLISLALAAALFAVSAPRLPAEPFTVSAAGDGLVLAGGAGLSAVAWFIPDAPVPPLEDLDPARIFFADRYMVNPYRSAVDAASDWLQYAAFLAPAVLAVRPVGEWPAIATMYAETAFWTFGTATLLKKLVVRARPYRYWDTTEARLLEEADSWRSFPSRHTALAFGGATFASYVFARYEPDSPWRWPVFGVSYGLALSVAATRIASGSHFLSDVVAGAALGSAIGFLVPWLHEEGNAMGSKAASLRVSPDGVYISLYAR